MEYLSLVFLHLFAGLIWAGGAITVGFFVLPSVLQAGPSGGAVMAGIVKRRFSHWMIGCAIVTILTGIRLYMLRFSTAWLSTGEGMAISLGALLALAAFFMGVSVQKPTADKMAALAARIGAAGSPPSPEQIAELRALGTRLAKIARVAAWHLLAAVALMASHRLLAIL